MGFSYSIEFVEASEMELKKSGISPLQIKALVDDVIIEMDTLYTLFSYWFVVHFPFFRRLTSHPLDSILHLTEINKSIFQFLKWLNQIFSSCRGRKKKVVF